MIIKLVIVGVVLLGLFGVVLWRRRATRQGGGDQKAQPNQLYVGNLSYRAREKHLREAFADFGEISSLRVMKDRQTGRSRGYAFITYASAGAAKKAQSLHNTEWMGRTLVVRPALDKRF